MEAQVTQEVREYIVTTWLSGDGRDFTDDTDLQTSGILDSFATLALVAFLDDRFKARLDPTDINTETFRTIRSVVKLTLYRLQEPQA